MTNYDYQDETFLERLYEDLKKDLKDAVTLVAAPSDNKNEEVIKYLEKIQRVEEKVISQNRISLLKQYYYKKYIIKPDNVPESYFELQKQSLDAWLDYLLSNEAMYPEWFKYYVFQGMVKLGNYDKKNGCFNRRTSSTTNIFVDLNKEALSLIYDYLNKVLNGQKVNDEILQRLLENDSFSKLYAHTIKTLALSSNDVVSKDGIWIKYNQGYDSSALVASLQGRGTGWCEDRFESAMFMLFGGDIYVYYTKDSNGQYKQPRIAIRMIGNRIAEVKGIAEHQAIESEMLEKLVKKLEEFPDKKKYLKKVSDINKIAKIYNEYKMRDLTNEELRFLYEIDAEIEGFDRLKDPRINEILKDRNTKKDLTAALNCSEDEISDDIQDVLNGKKIVCFFGDLNLDSLTSIDGVVLPEYIRGSLSLNNLTSAKGSKFPKYIGGYLKLRHLTSAKDVVFPEYIGDHLDLYSLTSAEGSKFPEYIGGCLNLRSLTSAKGLKFPEYIGGYLHLGHLTSANGVVLPKYIGDDLDLNGLADTEGLILPEFIGGSLTLGSLTSANGLIFPEHIGAFLKMDSLINAENLTFSKSISGVDLNDLISAKNIVLPEYIWGTLNLNSLTVIENTVFPKYITGALGLNSLTSINDLVLPEYIGNHLDLRNLTSANGLVLPKNINEYLDLRSLTSLDGIIVPRGFKCEKVISSIFTVEDLIAKSMENDNNINQKESKPPIKQ